MKLPLFDDPDTKKPSVTMTAFVLGFIVATLKLLISGLEIEGLKMAAFDGSDFAMVVAALGGIYTLRRHSDNVTNKSKQDENESK